MPSLPVLLTRLGQVIRTLRAGAGYSQERFGFAIRRHRTYMGLLERGKANPTVKTLNLVAEGLGVSVPELFALAAAERSGAVSLPGGKRLGQGKDPAITAGRRESSTQPAGKPRSRRRKPGK